MLIPEVQATIVERAKRLVELGVMPEDVARVMGSTETAVPFAGAHQTANLRLALALALGRAQEKRAARSGNP